MLPESRIPRLGTINYKIGKLLDSVVTVELGCSCSNSRCGYGEDKTRNDKSQII